MSSLLEIAAGFILPLLVLVLMIVIIIASRSVSEFVAALILVMALLFFYAGIGRGWMRQVPVIQQSPLADWLWSYHQFIIERLPTFRGIRLLEQAFRNRHRRLLRVFASTSHTDGPWCVCKSRNREVCSKRAIEACGA